MRKSTKKPEKKTGGNNYRSNFEQRAAKYLESKGVAFEYEKGRIQYTVPEKKKNYVPDFVLPNGIVVEMKGKLDRQTREKMSLVIEQNPDRDIRFVFMRDNKLSKDSKTRYSDWAKKKGVKFHVSEEGHIPMEWLV